MDKTSTLSQNWDKQRLQLIGDLLTLRAMKETSEQCWRGQLRSFCGGDIGAIRGRLTETPGPSNLWERRLTQEMALLAVVTGPLWLHRREMSCRDSSTWTLRTDALMTGEIWSQCPQRSYRQGYEQKAVMTSQSKKMSRGLFATITRPCKRWNLWVMPSPPCVGQWGSGNP